MRAYKIIAHRGASAYEPENTIRAIMRAIDLGADMVEVDTHSTVDEQLVVIHDAEVDRTTNARGIVREMSFQEIRKLDAGNGEKVPTLREVLRASRNKIGVMIEVKGVGIERLLVDMLLTEKALGYVVVTSFMTDALRKVKALNRQISTGQIFSWKMPDMAHKGLELGVSCMLPQYELVTEETVREIHAHNLSLFPWTVDSRSAAERLLRFGVDGIVTDKPDLLSESQT